MLSFGIECENQTPILTDTSMGIDLGVKEQAVAAYGDDAFVFHNINKSKRVRELESKIRHTQRGISRKYESSKKRTGRYEKTKNIVKEGYRLRKLYYRLRNIRHNYIHHITHTLTSLHPHRVVMELNQLTRPTTLHTYNVHKTHMASCLCCQCLYYSARQDIGRQS